MRLALLAGCIAAACLWTVPAGAADRTAWQIKAEIAVRHVLSDEIGEKIRAILTAVGKNTRVTDITVEPDGDGVLAKFTLKWTGIVIAVDYRADLRWRFTRDAHIISGIDSLVGLGLATDKTKRELDDYLRTKLFPLVKEEAAR